MSILNDRIKELRIKNGYTLLQLSELLNVKEATAQRYESGEIKNIKYATIVKLATIFHCSPAYLMGWEKAVNTFDIFSIPGIMPIAKKRFPLLGSSGVACGNPILADNNFEGYIEAGSDIAADYCLRANGDSMINARINDGDIVFIRQQSDVDDGDIAVVLIDDEATLKRVYKIGNSRLELRAENPTFEVLNFEGEQLNNIRILGKAVAFQSDIK